MKRLPCIVVPTRSLHLPWRSLDLPTRFDSPRTSHVVSPQRSLISRRTALAHMGAVTGTLLASTLTGCSSESEAAILGFLELAAEKLIAALVEELAGSAEFTNSGTKTNSVTMALTLMDDTDTDVDEGLVVFDLEPTGDSQTVLWGGLGASSEGTYYTQGKALGTTRRTQTVTVTAA